MLQREISEQPNHYATMRAVTTLYLQILHELNI